MCDKKDYVQRYAAEDLAEKRGCVQENDCWEECVWAAMEDLDLLGWMKRKESRAAISSSGGSA